MVRISKISVYNNIIYVLKKNLFYEWGLLWIDWKSVNWKKWKSVLARKSIYCWSNWWKYIITYFKHIWRHHKIAVKKSLLSQSFISANFGNFRIFLSAIDFSLKTKTLHKGAIYIYNTNLCSKFELIISNCSIVILNNNSIFFWFCAFFNQNS